MEADSINETMQFAIQAQEEIRQELLAEIQKLENPTQAPKYTLKSIQFYSSSLRHVVEDKSAVLQELDRLRNQDLPESRAQLKRIEQKREALEHQINIYKRSRDSNILDHMEDTEQLEQYYNGLEEEIQLLERQEMEIDNVNLELKQELRVLQEKTLCKRRESAEQTWTCELADEKCKNQECSHGRRRSNTIAAPKKGRIINRRMSVKSVRPTPPKLTPSVFNFDGVSPP